jgi:hypothetical protein
MLCFALSEVPYLAFNCGQDMIQNLVIIWVKSQFPPLTIALLEIWDSSNFFLKHYAFTNALYFILLTRIFIPPSGVKVKPRRAGFKGRLSSNSNSTSDIIVPKTNFISNKAKE